MSVVIENASVDDAAAIAGVHISSLNASHRGLQRVTGSVPTNVSAAPVRT